ncbi:MAG: pyruvate carboxylase [Chloroflexi bacterium CG_4_9_14_3_um_filter_45_9]|nr:MAG: carboxylase [Dehalococcoidia bacterium CG2_30_46_9]PIU23349.1 MAG: pyruvate carboxylase [Chloroflexi bacterium CG08_land_8_20_14_0_20_45_12]PIX27704.1 MAG: pyruvate carboxylase [Chloroflexi bacterium CG_4_8_14_3_um_filter_45_15]PJB49953.1 MAG: pyruvate carboxylase [Chloroflexi bacterium CG_4_9_14_3_um_filter_45_9]
MSLTNNRNPLKITDLTFRDGHQSLLATRVRTEDLSAIAPEMDKAGFWSMEVWGGATFDVMTRFLNEDPWERIRILKRLMHYTPLQMLLRGQNLVGYRNYADDVVTAFIHHAADCGIDIFRVFDAVNDERNFETAFKVIKNCGKHVQGALCYSLTEPKLGGPIYNIDYYVKKALLIQDMGADSLCIKDMAGLIAPDDAYSLVTALKKALKIPVDLHSHFTSGMACMSYLKAIEAGVDIIDTCIAPFALRTAHPAIEPIVVAFQRTSRDTGLDLEFLLKLDEYFESIAPKYREFWDNTKMSVIDSGVLGHHIPGGMFTNMVAQLKEANALDRLPEVYAELPKTRKELGYPPLVTPTSQIVGAQAVQNVLFGRYKMISQEVKDYVYGLYGKPPVSIDTEVQKIVLKGYERGDKPITCRAADILPPELDKAREATKNIARDIGDVLIYALYPTTGMKFLRWKYAQEAPPVPRQMRGRVDEALPLKPATKEETAPATEKVKVAEGETKLTAPMPGLIIGISVKEGDYVDAGAPVAILEAMKMQNILSAPESGKIKAIRFKPGDNVKAGDVIAIIA